MGHHKRRRPKNRRSGCLWCKFWKANGEKGKLGNQTLQERRSRASEREQVDAGRSEARALARGDG